MVSFYKKILQIGVILFSLNCQSCSGCNCLNKAIDIPDGDIIPYEQLISKMDKYLTPNCPPGKERLVVYAMVFLQEGINSGKILQKELDKYTYLFELKVSKAGRVIDVSIQNSEIKGANDEYFIEYLKKMPQCKFWEAYDGKDKESLTTIYLPLRF